VDFINIEKIVVKMTVTLSDCLEYTKLRHDALVEYPHSAICEVCYSANITEVRRHVHIATMISGVNVYRCICKDCAAALTERKIKGIGR